jgi:hypothetical protein
MKFYTQGVEFEDIKTVLRIYLKQGKSLEQVLSLFNQAENKELVAQMYPTLAPITVKEAISLANSEQRAAALKSFVIEEIISNLNATLEDKQVIKKSHIRWDENLKPYEHKFEDTYELYRIPSDMLGLESEWGNPDTLDVYFVKCNCTSTDRQYYLYIPQNVGVRKDAIAAIAWTMQFNGQHLTKQQYLNLMYSET